MTIVRRLIFYSSAAFLAILLCGQLATSYVPSTQTFYIGFFGTDNPSMAWLGFEAEGLFIARTLFGGRGKIMNGWGPRSPYIDDYHMDAHTWWKAHVHIRYSQINAQPATYKHLKEAFQQAAASGLPNLTVFIDSHGSPTALEGWENEISFQQLFALEDSVPSSMVVRRIEDTCYSEGAIRRTSPILATDSKSLSLRMKQLFPANRCALSVSKADESTTLRNLPTSDPHSQFSHIFAPHLSLSEIQSRFWETNTSSTPMLTSDEFVSEVLRYLCHSSARDVRQKFLCLSESHAQDFKKLTKVMDDFDDFEDAQLDLLMSRRYPRLWARHGSSREQLEAALARGASDDEIRRIDVRDLRFVQTKQEILEENDFLDTLSELSDSDAHLPRQASLKSAERLRRMQFYEKRLEQLTQGLVQSPIGPLIDAAKHYQLELNAQKNRAYYKATTLRRDLATLFGRKAWDWSYPQAQQQFSQVSDQWLARLIKERVKLDDAKRQFVVSWLSDKSRADLKAIFDNVTACETTPIN